MIAFALELPFRLTIGMATTLQSQSDLPLAVRADPNGAAVRRHFADSARRESAALSAIGTPALMRQELSPARLPGRRGDRIRSASLNTNVIVDSGFRLPLNAATSAADGS